MQSQPPKKPRSKRLKLSKKEEWRKILKDVEKNEVPVHFLKSLTVNLKDGTAVHVDIDELINEGMDPAIIEKRLNAKLHELEIYINDVDFFINVDTVSKTIQTYTDKLLKNL